MMMNIASDLLEQIATHGRQTYPHECCGLMLGTTPASLQRTVHQVIPASNVQPREQAHHRYRIDPVEYLRADRQARSQGWDIVGIYHTHPDEAPAPSPVDLDHAWPWYVYLIMTVRHGRAADYQAWQLNEATSSNQKYFQPVQILVDNGG